MSVSMPRPNKQELDKLFDFNRYDWVILSNIWNLEKEDSDLLDRHHTYLLSSSDFFSRLKAPEDMTVSFNDRLVLSGLGSFVVYYHQTSKDVLTYLNFRNPATPLVLDFRVNIRNKFYAVLVRKFTKSLALTDLVQWKIKD